LKKRISSVDFISFHHSTLYGERVKLTHAPDREDPDALGERVER